MRFFQRSLRRLRRATAFASLVLVGAVLSGCVADVIDRRLNKVVVPDDLPQLTDTEKTAHRKLFVVDLHADSMLWNRDLLEKADWGHVDLPRLVEGNVALQVFAMVTKTPFKGRAPADAVLIPEIANDPNAKCMRHDSLNLAGLLQFAQGRPLRTWFDLEQRALYQAERLKAFIAESQRRHDADPTGKTPRLMLIRNADDLARLVELRGNRENVVGALIALEGAHWIGETQTVEAGIDKLFDAGFRMLAPTHRFNNTLSAASEGCDQLAGLTDHGRAFLRYAHDKGMILDLAHASDSGIAEAAGIAKGPLVVSHTGIRVGCKDLTDCTVERNMRDQDIQAVARTGGVVAIGYWPQAVGSSMKNVVKGFQNARRALSDKDFVEEMPVGYDPLDHIALGSDYDGAVQVPFDTSGLSYITSALVRTDFTAGQVAQIAGGNACRVFAERLPGGSAARAREICKPYLGQ